MHGVMNVLFSSICFRSGRQLPPSSVIDFTIEDIKEAKICLTRDNTSSLVSLDGYAAMERHMYYHGVVLSMQLNGTRKSDPHNRARIYIT